MAVEDRRDLVARERLFEPAAPEVRIDLPRFAFDGFGDRRVVQQRDPRRRAQARERRFELQRFVRRPRGRSA